MKPLIETDTHPTGWDYESLEQPPETGDGEQYNADIKRLLREVLNTLKANPNLSNYDALEEAAQDVEEWFENSDDPKENGWVGSNGLP